MEPDPHLTKRGKPRPPWIKKEEEEPDSLMINPKWWVPKHLPTKPDQKDLCHRLKGVQHVHNQSIALIETFTLQGGDLGEEDPRAKQLSFHIFPEDEIKDQAESPSVSESQTDTKKRSLKCDICGRCCKNTHLLKQHYRTHTGEKPF
ncbi:hypothetical protein XENOCAPTIV_004363 [Xenoophorus captivus]|uniref:C2H2-type domain-containing protein n=1 Tax=Xenoophorus captivus TaxID=1517983 RepID=A0ABV0QPW0_9TELE